MSEKNQGRVKQIKVIKAKNMIEKVPKLDDRELYVIGHEKEDIDEARRQLEEEKEVKKANRVLKGNNKDLASVYTDIEKLINYYMDMPEDQVRMVTTWIIGTYMHSAFSTYPFLFINAMRGSGKTRLLRIISHLANKCGGEVQTGMSEAVLFRMETGNTLVLDEIESIGGKDKAIFREYLNACYKVGGSVKRMKKSKSKEGEGYEIETFFPYKPVAMANIWGMEEVLGDRCMTFILEKSNNASKTKKVEDFEGNNTFSEIKLALESLSVVSVVSLRKKNYLKEWNDFIDYSYNTPNNTTTYTTHTTLTTLTTPYKDLFEKVDSLDIDGRNFELLFPLLLVSNMIGEEHFNKMLGIGKDIMDNKKSDEFAESADVSIYQFISSQSQVLNYMAMKELTSLFRTYRGEEDWINEKWMGRALKRLNLIIDSKRLASGRFVMINVAKASEKCKMFATKEKPHD